MKENNTNNEHLDTDNLPESLRVNPFEVPKDYFTELEDQICSQIHLDTLEVNPHFGNSVPEGYFDSLEDQILGKVAEEKLREQIQETGFTVPQEYFHTLSAQILTAVHTDKPAIQKDKPVIQMNKGFAWTRYAAAASIALVLGLSAFWGLKSNTAASSTESVDLAEVSDQEIINYLASSSNPNDIIYFAKYADDLEISPSGIGTQVHEEEIEDYLKYML